MFPDLLHAISAAGVSHVYRLVPVGVFPSDGLAALQGDSIAKKTFATLSTAKHVILKNQLIHATRSHDHQHNYHR